MNRLRALLGSSLVLAFACNNEAPPPSQEAPRASSTQATAPSAPSTNAPAAIPSSPAPDSIAAQHVLVAYKGAKAAPKGITRSKAEASARAAEVSQKARAGTDFSELVALYSDDPAAKERQGSLGKFTRSSKVKPFADAAFALPVDGVSDPVETEFGFHVIKRNQ